MTAIRATVSVFVSFTLMVLLVGPAFGQFKETNEPPGYLLQWGNYGSSDGQFNGVMGVAVDGSGNIFVTDQFNRRIQKFDSAGNFLTKWGSWGSGDGQFELPAAVAVDASCNVYVADRSFDRIQKFDSVGNFLTKWGSGFLDSPYGVAADATGNVYVADTNNHRIVKFDCVGNYLDQWGTNGSGESQFDHPFGLAVDATGNVYVADGYNDRIQKFDSAGAFLAKWGGAGSGDGQFDTPWDVDFDTSGNVYVSDRFNHRIQKFDSAGNFLAKWGSNGGGDSQFDNPFGLASDTFGNVYVADSNNYRIQKFAPVLWFDVAGYDSYLSVATLHETTAIRTLFQLENNGAPRFAFTNTNSDIEWSFQQSGPGNFLISKEGTGGPEMQVYQTGMVRMGPGGANRFTLYPNGNLVIAGSLSANGSTFPDYVFEPDYNLMPLSDLRTYIETEKRLPDIPSAEEVKQQGGHNMTELQLKLLEKIEELTLYTLEQQSELQQVKRENAGMKAENAEIKARLATIESMLSDR